MILRRILIVVASLGVTWLALELWFGYRNPPANVVTVDGEKVRTVFVPSDELLRRWENQLVRVKRGEELGGICNVFSSRYGWANRSGVSGKHRDTVVSFNSIGARSTREVGEAPPEGVLRVGCYGESFTFGTDVNDGETWPDALELRSQGALEVLNMGVGGWGTDQALLRFRDTREQLGSDVVLLGVLAENIARNVNRLRNVYWAKTMSPLVKPRFILEGGELELLPVPYASYLELLEASVDGSLGVDMAEHEYWADTNQGSWSSVIDAVQERRSESRRIEWWRLWWEPDSEPFRVTLAMIEAFHREALEGGARFAGVVLFPAHSDLSNEQRRLTALTAILEERGIPYFEVYDLIKARKERGERAYGVAHFTAETNAEVGAATWEWLSSELEL